MTFIELLTFAAIIYAGYACGEWMGLRFGIIGSIVGFVLGSSAMATAWLAFRRLIGILHKWCPLRPTCKNGKCSSDDYEIVESSKDGATFRCRCGTKYFQPGLLSRRFMEILDDGSRIPYMRRKGVLRRWELE